VGFDDQPLNHDVSVAFEARIRGDECWGDGAFFVNLQLRGFVTTQATFGIRAGLVEAGLRR
jgi:hypothetical protein